MSNTFGNFSQTGSFPDNAFELYAKTVLDNYYLSVSFSNITGGGTYIIKALVRCDWDFAGTSTNYSNDYKTPYLYLQMNSETSQYCNTNVSYNTLSKSSISYGERFEPFAWSDNKGVNTNNGIILGNVPYNQHPINTFSFITAQVNNSYSGAVSVYSSGGIGTPELYSSTALTGSTSWDAAGHRGIIPYKPTLLVGHSSGARRNLSQVTSFSFYVVRPVFKYSGIIYPQIYSNMSPGSEIYIYKYKVPISEM